MFHDHVRLCFKLFPLRIILLSLNSLLNSCTPQEKYKIHMYIYIILYYNIYIYIYHIIYIILYYIIFYYIILYYIIYIYIYYIYYIIYYIIYIYILIYYKISTIPREIVQKLAILYHTHQNSMHPSDFLW